MPHPHNSHKVARHCYESDEPVNGENRISSSSVFLSSLSAPSAFTRAVPIAKHPRKAVKFSWQVPFELSFENINLTSSAKTKCIVFAQY